MNVRKWLEDHSLRILAIRDTPEAIAGGVAVGFFFGLTPLFGLKTMLSILFAWLFRCNLVAAFIGVTLHDLAFFFIPVILRTQYDVGYWLLSSPHRLPTPVRHLHLSIDDWMNWQTLRRIGLPLLTGSLVFALPFSLASFFVTRSWVVRHRRKKLASQVPVEDLPPQPS